ncbi:MAG: isochorismatase family protein [Bacteroidota bacterium]
MRYSLLLFGWIWLTNSCVFAQGNEFEVRLQSREKDSKGQFQIEESPEIWQAKQTALIICDMWNLHWCPQSTARVEELAPFMNSVVEKAREMGIMIIHAPSDVTDFYEGHPARIRAQKAPKSANLPPEIQTWCSWLDEGEQKVYPIDQSDGGCECQDCDSYTAWTKQVESIHIYEEDAISDSGEEIWNLMDANDIHNVMLVGVHTNMCVLGRPFGLRNMSRYGKNVVLIRDLTDTMYNPKSWPYVDHFSGTDLIIQHIESYVCPTIISTSITGQEAFRFSQDRRSK